MTEYISSVPHIVYTVMTEFTIQNSEVIQWDYYEFFVLYFFNIIPYTLLAIRTVGELMWQ